MEVDLKIPIESIGPPTPSSDTVTTSMVSLRQNPVADHLGILTPTEVLESCRLGSCVKVDHSRPPYFEIGLSTTHLTRVISVLPSLRIPEPIGWVRGYTGPMSCTSVSSNERLKF